MTAPRLLLLAPLVAATLVLGGCSLLPIVSAASTSTPTAAPAPAGSVLPEDEASSPDSIDALLAAEEVMVEYLRISDAIRHDGGQGVDRLRPLVSDELYAATVAEAEHWQQQGFRQRGNRVLRSSTITLTMQFAGLVDIESSHCISGSDVDIVNAAGEVVGEFETPSSVLVNAIVSFDREGNGMVYALDVVDKVEACDDVEP